MIYFRLIIILILICSFSGCSTTNSIKKAHDLEAISKYQIYQVRVRTGNLSLDRSIYSSTRSVFNQFLPVSEEGPFTGFIEVEYSAESGSITGKSTPSFKRNIRYGNSWYTGSSDNFMNFIEDDVVPAGLLKRSSSEMTFTIRENNGSELWHAEHRFKGGESTALSIGGPAESSARKSLNIILSKFISDFPDDYAGIKIIESAGSTSVDETGPTADTYFVVLTKQPETNVVLNIQSTDSATGAIVDRERLTFSSRTWHKPQPLTVTAVNDGLIEGNPHSIMITHDINTELTTDTDYTAIQGSLESLTVIITDSSSTKPKETFPIALFVKSRWDKAGKNRHGHTVYTDSHSVTYPSEDIIKVWTKATLGGKNYLDQIEIHCTISKFRFLDGRLDKNPSLSPYPEAWTSMSPESTPELIFKALCPKLQPSPQ